MININIYKLCNLIILVRSPGVLHSVICDLCESEGRETFKVHLMALTPT